MVDIAVCIPTYNEDNIANIVSMILQQRTEHKYHIVIADYDPNKTGRTRQLLGRLPVTFVTVDRPGIAYARHNAIMASKANIIINMDADSRFATLNCIDLIVRPIIEKTAVLCICDNEWDESEIKNPEQDRAMEMPRSVLSFLNQTQKVDPFHAFLEPGSAFDKDAYIFVGGFKDVKMWELFDLSPRLYFSYPNMKKYINGAKVIVSCRRAVASSKYGLLQTYGNYDNSYR